MKYNQLTTISKPFGTCIYNNNRKYAVVVCRCDCGKYVCIRYDYLKGGNTKSCGCKKTKKIVPKKPNTRTHVKYKDLHKLYVVEGLTVKRVAEKMNCCVKTIRKRIKMYGINKNVRSGEKSPYWQGKGKISKTYWNQIVHGAELRDITFDITFDYIWDLFLEQNQKCALTGLPLSFDLKNQTASLDRKDSKLGYIEDNLQWVHKKSIK